VDEGKLKLRARIVKFERRIATVEAELISGKGISCAEAIIEYYVLSEEKAKENFITLAKKILNQNPSVKVMKFNFDEVLHREGTDCMKYDARKATLVRIISFQCGLPIWISAARHS